MDLAHFQESLQKSHLDGWLFFDHHSRDPLAYRVLGLPNEIVATRRWYYFIPAKGDARKLVHRIESGTLDKLPGHKECYSSWSDQQNKLRTMLKGANRVAMQYSPNCSIPYVSMVDAGTAELIRALDVELVSSANLIQEFESKWSDEQLETHLEAGRLVDQIRREAFELVSHRTRLQEVLSEYEVQQFIRRRSEECGLTTDHGPIVAVNANASDPHYEPARERTSVILAGDLVLIDMWAKLDRPHAVFYDITWTGYCGDIVPERMNDVFQIVRGARVAAWQFCVSKTEKGEPFAGFEVDDVARGIIEKQGYGENFFHRTGHNIGTDVHGTGANMDNLESHDDRLVLARTCFSIEPGVYLPDFGIRSEVNVYMGNGTARVTGEQQDEILRI